MRLLILTQKIDNKDPVLGFFHNWVQKLAPNFEKISVVCLEKGECHLPQNVKVYSLGKETGKSKIKYVLRFFNFILGLAMEYDTVFVHMNQEYVLLGGVFWKILGKPVYLWRNHPKGNIFTRLAVAFSKKVFYTSPYSYTARFKQKGVLIPVGIDTDKFKVEKAQVVNPGNSILCLGRISPIKNIDKLVEAAILLDKKGVDFRLDIVGDPVNPEDKEYCEELKIMAKDLIGNKKINFIPAVDQDGAVKMYQNHGIFINLTPSGSMDKTILEAMACGCIPIVANEYYKNVKNVEVTSLEINEIATKIESALDAGVGETESSQNSLRQYVVENHGLSRLIEILSFNIQAK